MPEAFSASNCIAGPRPAAAVFVVIASNLRAFWGELVPEPPAIICNGRSGLEVPIPTLSAEESTTNVSVSQIKSPVPPVKLVNVPNEVILVWAAVASVPAIVPPETLIPALNTGIWFMVTTPSLAIAIASVSDVCPIFVPFIIILSTVSVVSVPSEVILPWAAVDTVPAILEAVIVPTCKLA